MESGTGLTEMVSIGLRSRGAIARFAGRKFEVFISSGEERESFVRVSGAAAL